MVPLRRGQLFPGAFHRPGIPSQRKRPQFVAAEVASNTLLQVLQTPFVKARYDECREGAKRYRDDPYRHVK